MVRQRVAALSVVAGAIAFAFAFGGAVSAVHQEARDPEEVRSEAVVARVCGECHVWQRMADSRRTKAQWEELIDDMMNRGASGSDDDYNTILAYALRNYGFVNVNKGPADEIALVLGLSSKEAEAIVTYRTAHGKFADFDALKQVGGVAPKKLDAVRRSILY